MNHDELSYCTACHRRLPDDAPFWNIPECKQTAVENSYSIDGKYHVDCWQCAKCAALLDGKHSGAHVADFFPSALGPVCQGCYLQGYAKYCYGTRCSSLTDTKRPYK